MCARYAISVCSRPGQCSSRSRAVARANRSEPQELERSLLDAWGESRLAACQPRADKEITNKSNASATNFLPFLVHSEANKLPAISHSAHLR